MHASTVDVKIGDKVLPDTVLGKTGNTGTGPIHLHVQAPDATGKKINPKDILGRPAHCWMSLVTFNLILIMAPPVLRSATTDV